ncbi:MAG: hypothetical protein P8Y71_16940 [Pseudolabrys sp.]
MLKFFVGAVAFAFATLPVTALAQTTSYGTNSVKIAMLSGQNSGARANGERGSENSPAPKVPETTGSAVSISSRHQVPLSADDAAFVPGLTGAESGPAVMPPSS